MDQYPAKLSQPHPTAASPPPDCGAHPALHEPLPYPPTSFDPQSFTCITPPYGSRAAPLFAECCDSPVLNLTTVHLTSEGPSSCAAYCNVKPDRLLVSDYQSSDFYTCVFGGPEQDKDVYVQLECWDGEGFVGGLDWEDRFAENDDSNLKKRSAQENTDAPESSSASTTTYDPSFWSSLISAAATETASIVLPTEPMTPVLPTTTTATATNGTAASSSNASLASGTFVSVSEVSGTRSSTSPAETSASATSGAASSGGSSASSSASAAESSSTSGAGVQFEGGYGKWVCTGLLLSFVFASLQ